MLLNVLVSEAQLHLQQVMQFSELIDMFQLREMNDKQFFVSTMHFLKTFFTCQYLLKATNVIDYCCIVDIVIQIFVFVTITVPQYADVFTAENLFCDFSKVKCLYLCPSRFLRTIQRDIDVRQCACSWSTLCRLWRMTSRQNVLSLRSTSPSPRQHCHAISSSLASGEFGKRGAVS